MMASLRKTIKSAKRSARRSARKTRKGKRGTKRPLKKGSKKKLNSYMVKMLKARRSGAKSFKYKGKTYKKKSLKAGMVVYKG